MIRGAPGYEERRRACVWQRVTPDRYPAAIVRVESREDAAAAVAAARRVSVMSSGHSYIGNALQDDAVLLDLAALDTVEVDGDTARVGPAVTNGALDARLAPFGLAFPVGHSPSVAVGGYLLGGGLGWNPDGWGTAACGHVTGATVLLASGATVHTRDHPELFFALRGAGPCFPGIVLEYEVGLLPRPAPITELTACYPLSAAGAVARWAATVTTAADVELAVVVADGTVTVTATAFGDVPLPDPPPGGDRTLRTRTLPEMLADNDAPPQRHAVEGIWSDRPREVLLACAERAAPDALIHVSVRSRVTLPVDAAFSLAASTFVFSCASWDDPAADARHLAWEDGLRRALAPVTRGFYVNETDHLRHPDHLARCFAPDAWARLQRVRARYDPDGTFAPKRNPA